MLASVTTQSRSFYNKSTSIRAIAFYLPQYHPIPENDTWWQKGFTEWTNVAKARPLYRGHSQPKLPADLGFYDLRIPQVREDQAALARDASIEGFCYWHYWFGQGKRILEKPIQEVLDTGQPEFPFCFAWANETWSGIWYGKSKDILIEQKYLGPEDEAEHFEFLAKAFRDKRYIRVDGKPLLLIYRPENLPDRTRMLGNFRRLAKSHGFSGIFLVAMAHDFSDPYDDFDGVTNHTPGDFMKKHRQGLGERALKRAVSYGALPKWLAKPARFQFSKVVDEAFAGMPANERIFPCVLPGWDNTPRSGNRGFVFEGSSPFEFERMLLKAKVFLDGRLPERRIIFIKAWNEWAEGNYLEPGQEHGHGYLDVMRRQFGSNH